MSIRSFAFSLAISWVSQVSAEVILDQEFVGPSGAAYSIGTPGDYMAQTFTVRNSGQLAGVGVQVGLDRFRTTPLIYDLELRLLKTDSSGVPKINEVLAARTINRFDLPQWAGNLLPMFDVDLTAESLHVDAGDVLAIALSSNFTPGSPPGGGNKYVWSVNPTQDQIPGGCFFVYAPDSFGPVPFNHWLIGDPVTTGDAGYRVFVSVPEPSLIVSVLLGSLALAGSRFARKELP